MGAALPWVKFAAVGHKTSGSKGRKHTKEKKVLAKISTYPPPRKTSNNTNNIDATDDACKSLLLQAVMEVNYQISRRRQGKMTER